jgi:hypothetical protein
MEALMRTRIVAIVLGAVLAGCASGHWVSEGAAPGGFSAVSERCETDSWSAFPEPALYGEPCNADGSYMNCSVRSAEVRALPRTQADLAAQAERAKARRGSYRQCMEKLGWRWVPAG